MTSEALCLGLRIWKYISIRVFQMGKKKKDLLIIISCLWRWEQSFLPSLTERMQIVKMWQDWKGQLFIPLPLGRTTVKPFQERERCFVPKNIQVRMVKIKKSRWESPGALKLMKLPADIIPVKSHFYLPIAWHLANFQRMWCLALLLWKFHWVLVLMSGHCLIHLLGSKMTKHRTSDTGHRG